MNKAIKRYWPIFLLPTMAAFLIGFIVPFIEGIYLSFCDFTTIKDATFVGFNNYIAAFKDTTFVDAFKFLLLKSPAKYDLPEKYLAYATFFSPKWKMLVFAIT